MGDQPEVQDLTGDSSNEIVELTFLGMDDSTVTLSKSFEGGAQLTQVAGMFKRFLLAAGYIVEDVIIDTGPSTFAASEEY